MWLVEKQVENHPIGRSRSRCESDIKDEFREIHYEVRRRIELVQDRVQWRYLVLLVVNNHILVTAALYTHTYSYPLAWDQHHNNAVSHSPLLLVFY
jgi:hypothetical protein